MLETPGHSRYHPPTGRDTKPEAVREKTDKERDRERARSERVERSTSTMIRVASGAVAAAARAGPVRVAAASRGLSSLVPLDEEYMG